MTNSNLFKYPRTPHLPCSPGTTSDDKKLTESQLKAYYCGVNVTYTEKMDGENTTMYSDYIHARSLDSRHHPSRDWVKRFHSEFAHNIPPLWRVCGENLFAKHSISYDNLDSYFYGFSIWDENNLCLSWEDTKLWFSILGIRCVPEITDVPSITCIDAVDALGKLVVGQGKEGFVARRSSCFEYSRFERSVVKYVRANHVQTETHWMSSTVVPNKLRD